MTEDIKLIAVLEDLPVGTILLNANGHIIAVNNAFLNIISYKKEKLIGKAIGAILSFPTKGKYNNFRALFAETSSTDKQIAEIKNKNGKVFRLEFKLCYSGDDNEKFYIGFIKENEQETNLKLELKRQITLKDSIKDELEQENELSEMKSRFLSIASHEFRTPLAGILSSLNLIDRYFAADQQTWFKFKNREKVVNHLIKINESVKNLTTILNIFLALGHIEEGEIPVRLVRFDLVRALKTQRSHFQEICKPGQKISYYHNGNETFAYLDKYLLKNIMINLLSNAVKFSHENSEIGLYTEITSDKIHIKLIDKGIGIPKADQNKIFSRFFRSKNAVAFQDGTGLGLNIVKKYVELMNGSITFESEENSGTTFYITFPNETI